jgi:hypothetical protein
LSDTIACGRPPRRCRQPTSAAQNEAVVQAKVNTTRSAAEAGKVETRPNA